MAGCVQTLSGLQAVQGSLRPNPLDDFGRQVLLHADLPITTLCIQLLKASH